MINSRYLDFYLVANLPKTQIWQVLSKRSGFVLGHVRWYGQWRQYAFMPSPSMVFNSECMNDICSLIKELMGARQKPNPNIKPPKYDVVSEGYIP
jgi:hypothetical protein